MQQEIQESLSAEQAEVEYGISRYTVYSWVKRGQIVGVDTVKGKLGRPYHLFARDELERCLAESPGPRLVRHTGAHETDESRLVSMPATSRGASTTEASIERSLVQIPEDSPAAEPPLVRREGEEHVEDNPPVASSTRSATTIQRKITSKRLDCLRCDRPFTSPDHVLIRVCPGCKETKAWKE